MQIMLSIIVTTYNWPQALKLVLMALAEQVKANMEIIIADDGSGLETKAMISEIKETIGCKVWHIWQPDEGFQAAKIRNKAIAKAIGDYLIFIDGDCIVAKDFIANHLKLKEKNHFVAGNRVLLTREFTQEIIQANPPFLLHQWGIWHWFLAKRKNKINRFTPCFKWRLLNKLMNCFSNQKWQGAKTCNLAVFKKDLIQINGFDESFTGWGFEDSDLIVRLMKAGVKRKEARFYAPVIHLWHAEQARDQAAGNGQKFEQVLDSPLFFSKLGLSQYDC